MNLRLIWHTYGIGLKMLFRTVAVSFAFVVAFALFADASRNPFLDNHLKNLGSDSPYREDADKYGSSRRADVEIPLTQKFNTPPFLEPRVNFWIKIYSKYTTNQIVIHDRENLDVIYDVINLDETLGKKKVSDKTKRRFIRNSEKRVAATLRKLHKNKGKPTTDKEEVLVRALESVDGRSKYKKASKQVRAQVGQANRFKNGLQRSGRYMTYIRATLRKYNLPEELAALPHVESSFNYRAYSSAGAAGIWQFTRSTGRQFMRVNYTVDDRRDPIASTVAAARLLGRSYKSLKSWPLAITSYNHGLGGMRKASRRHGANFETIVNKYKSRSFGFASKNFYAEFLAALEVSRNYRKYFGEVDFEPSLKFDEVKIPYYVSVKALSKKMGIPKETLKAYNPGLRKSVWSGRRYIPSGYLLKTPIGMKQGVLAALASIPKGNRHSRQQSDGFHVVRRGETLSTIARKERVSLGSLRNENNIWSDKIYVGQKLRLPSNAVSHKTTTPRKRATPPTPGEEYIVKRGDSLDRIARRNHVSLQSLFTLNGFNKRTVIYPGQKLLLSAQNQPIATVASIAPAAPISKIPATNKTTTTPSITSSEPVAETVTDNPLIQSDGEKITVSGKTFVLRTTDFVVKESGDGSGVVTVRTDETLGHYSEWLRVRKKTIERMNGGKILTRSMREGTKITIPTNVVSAEEFQRKRVEYHMELLEDFFEAYSIEDEQQLTIKRGESLWRLCVKENDVPLWLVALYNPGTDIHSLKPGDNLTIPVITKKR